MHISSAAHCARMHLRMCVGGGQSIRKPSALDGASEKRSGRGRRLVPSICRLFATAADTLLLKPPSAGVRQGPSPRPAPPWRTLHPFFPFSNYRAPNKSPRLFTKRLVYHPLPHLYFLRCFTTSRRDSPSPSLPELPRYNLRCTEQPSAILIAATGCHLWLFYKSRRTRAIVSVLSFFFAFSLIRVFLFFLLS
jgi:hypothetical protein